MRVLGGDGMTNGVIRNAEDVGEGVVLVSAQVVDGVTYNDIHHLAEIGAVIVIISTMKQHTTIVDIHFALHLYHASMSHPFKTMLRKKFHRVPMFFNNFLRYFLRQSFSKLSTCLSHPAIL